MNLDHYEKLRWTDEMSARYWDYCANFQQNYFTKQHGQKIINEFKEYLTPQSAVLDYGCGPGYLMERLLDHGSQVCGVDFSAESREHARQHFGHKRGFLGALSYDELVATDLRFDAAIAIELIEHLYDPQLDAFLGLMRRILKGSGTLILTTPNEEKLEESYILCPVTNQLFHRWQHVRSWSKAELTQYLEQRGFDVLACYSTDFRAHAGPAGLSLRETWSTLRRKAQYLRKPNKTRPHLCAVVRPRGP